MNFLERVYRITHRKSLKNGGKVPYWWKYSIGTVLMKPIRKFLSAVVIPTIPFNNVRVAMYRLCGYKIGKYVFIGLRCYLDDMCYDMITIEDNVGISYGVFFALHGQRQQHHTLLIKENTHIGEDLVIGSKCMIGAGSLVNKSIPDNSVAVGVPVRILPPKDKQCTPEITPLATAFNVCGGGVNTKPTANYYHTKTRSKCRKHFKRVDFYL